MEPLSHGPAGWVIRKPRHCSKKHSTKKRRRTRSSRRWPKAASISRPLIRRIRMRRMRIKKTRIKPLGADDVPDRHESRNVRHPVESSEGTGASYGGPIRHCDRTTEGVDRLYQADHRRPVDALLASGSR